MYRRDQGLTSPDRLPVRDVKLGRPIIISKLMERNFQLLRMNAADPDSILPATLQPLELVLNERSPKLFKTLTESRHLPKERLASTMAPTHRSGKWGTLRRPPADEDYQSW